MKLNKNQLRFFQEALLFFGDSASDVRYKDITEFAEKSNLMVPVTALKQCQREDLVRGHYDLTMSGVSVSKPIVESSSPQANKPPKDFDEGNEDVILESSSFGNISNEKNNKPLRKKFGYLVSDSNKDELHFCLTAEGAYNMIVRYAKGRYVPSKINFMFDINNKEFSNIEIKGEDGVITKMYVVKMEIEP